MIQVSDISKSYGPKRLFEDVSVTFSPGRRYGLTGPNGAGKSTFLKILSGDEEADHGQVSRPKKVGVLRQDHFRFDERRVVDTVVMGNTLLWAALTEKEKLLAAPEITEEMGVRLGELETLIAEEDGYEAESAAAGLLQGLGIPDELHGRPMRTLAGGSKLRVLLAQALFGKPQALLLDEPTNHLDLDSINWLIGFLTAYPGTLIVISHDRHFLNQICTHIADIDYQTIILYPGDYDEMVMAKSQLRGRVEAENADKRKKIAQLQDFVARFHAGTRASQVQSRVKQIEKLQLTELRRSNIQRPYIRFEQKRPSGKQTLSVEGLSKAYGSSRVLREVTFGLSRGEKVAVIGRNGIGKTTLVKCLTGELAPDAGKVTWGYETSIGVLAQDHRQGIPNGTTVADWLHTIDPRAGNEEIRGLLGRMLFSGEEGLKPTDALSGGEAVRLLFAKLMLVKDNVLVLDEPTNHLDLESIVALGEAIERFEGTVLYVTHDRALIDAASRILSLTPEGFLDFHGSYQELLEKHGESAARAR
ncbi:MAG: ABC-F family ATP-binding cassette domain-containing protein [Myxococcales bacterium]